METKCHHVFCFGCIYEWLGATTSCPSCEQDLYQTRKLRKQPSREIHPADRDVPHRFSSSEWIRATNTTPPRVLKKQTPSTPPNTLVVNKSRPKYLEVPKVSHQRTPSDRSVSAGYQHREVSFAPETRRGRIKCGRYSLPGYGLPTCEKDSSVPYQQYSLDSSTDPSLGVYSPKKHESIEVLDPAMIALISTCSEYLEREQQAAEQNVRILCIDSEEILKEMWAANNSFGKDVSVPIRCRAIAKCVWREWEDYLRKRDGSLVMDEELFWGLHANFEKTVIDYGWVKDWRELPADFVDLLERTMAVATQV